MQKQHKVQNSVAPVPLSPRPTDSPQTAAVSEVSEEIAALEKKILESDVPKDLEDRLLRMVLQKS